MRAAGLRVALILAALGASSVCAPPDAYAQPPPASSRSRAQELYRRGTELFRSGDFRAALEAFEGAYRLDPHPILAYNIARARESLGEIEPSIEAYRRYLELDPNASDRGAVEQRIATLKAQLDERRALEQRTQELARAKEEQQRREREGPRPPPPGPASPPSPVPWIVAGAGAAAVGVGAVLGAVALGKRSDAENAPNGLAGQEANEDAKSLGLVATIALIGGGAVALGGVVWGVVDVSRSSDGATRPTARAALSLSSHGLSIRARF